MGVACRRRLCVLLCCLLCWTTRRAFHERDDLRGKTKAKPSGARLLCWTKRRADPGRSDVFAFPWAASLLDRDAFLRLRISSIETTEKTTSTNVTNRQRPRLASDETSSTRLASDADQSDVVPPNLQDGFTFRFQSKKSEAISNNTIFLQSLSVSTRESGELPQLSKLPLKFRSNYSPNDIA